MEFLLIALVWLLSGVAGSALTLEFMWRRGYAPLDVDVGALLFFSLMALSGPLNLVVGVFFFIGWVFRSKVDTRRVVFKRRAS